MLFMEATARKETTGTRMLNFANAKQIILRVFIFANQDQFHVIFATLLNKSYAVLLILKILLASLVCIRASRESKYTTTLIF